MTSLRKLMFEGNHLPRPPAFVFELPRLGILFRKHRQQVVALFSYSDVGWFLRLGKALVAEGGSVGRTKPRTRTLSRTRARTRAHTRTYIHAHPHTHPHIHTHTVDTHTHTHTHTHTRAVPRVGLVKIPPDISRLRTLADLRVHDNKTLRHLPAALGALPRLTHLSAANCSLRQVPYELTQVGSGF